MAELTLYYLEMCPYCNKVRSFLEQEKISVPMKEIGSNPEHREELIKIGGKGQVPCLVIDGKPLYESNDIIQWFTANQKSAQ